MPRRSIRLPGYDYRQPGGYFVTLCTYRRAALFGPVAGGSMQHTVFGRLAIQRWKALPQHFAHVRLDAFVVMPDHLHGVIFITRDGERGADRVGERGADRVGEASREPGTSIPAGTMADNPEEGGFLANASPLHLHRHHGAWPDDARGPDDACTGEASAPPGTSAPKAGSPASGASATHSRDAAPPPRPASSACAARLRQRGDFPQGTASGSLGAIIQNYKSTVARQINRRRRTPGAPVWQRGYYEHIVRHEEALRRIRRYIAENPKRWEVTCFL